jgi:hypothetical protein
MTLFKDAGTVFLTIGAASGHSLPISLVEEISASGGCERGTHFNECLKQLIDLGLIARCGEQVWVPLPNSIPTKLLRSDVEGRLVK